MAPLFSTPDSPPLCYNIKDRHSSQGFAAAPSVTTASLFNKDCGFFNFPLVMSVKNKWCFGFFTSRILMFIDGGAHPISEMVAPPHPQLGCPPVLGHVHTWM